MTSDTSPNALPQDSTPVDLENTQAIALLAEIEEIKAYLLALLDEQEEYDLLPGKSFGGTSPD